MSTPAASSTANRPLGGRALRAWRWLTAGADGSRVTAWLFLRLLGLVYLVAFASLAVQVAGLVGPEGILPFARLIEARSPGDWAAWLRLPTVFWLGASDLALTGAAIAGMLAAALLVWGRFERLAAVLAFALYLSLFHAGQIFLAFQWDTLLLEAGFLAILLASGPSRLVLLLYEFLLFRFRFMSGVAKLATGDPSWANLTALDYYFQTQPLPHVGSWYAHQLPHALHVAATGAALAAELVVPWLIFMGRRARLLAAAVTVLVQLAIIATSNHAFANVLVIVLCVLLADDRVTRLWLPARLGERVCLARRRPGPAAAVVGLVAGLAIAFTTVSAFGMYLGRWQLPVAAMRFDDTLQAWGLGNIYHVFPTMQRERQELEVQGSEDGRSWRSYRFRYKPGPVDRAPRFIVPHHPRLDWLVWFVPMQTPWQLAWFEQFLNRLREGSPAVTALLAHNPFPQAPPRFIRVRAWRYRFTTPAERAATGHWWVREYLGRFPYVPPRRP